MKRSKKQKKQSKFCREEETLYRFAELVVRYGVQWEDARKQVGLTKAEASYDPLLQSLFEEQYILKMQVQLLPQAHATAMYFNANRSEDVAAKNASDFLPVTERQKQLFAEMEEEQQRQAFEAYLAKVETNQ